MRQQVNDIYNEVKNKLEEKGIALESVFYAKKDEDEKDRRGGYDRKKVKKEVEEPLSPQGVADKNGILRSFN